MEDILALLIGMVAVGGWIIPVTVKNVLKSKERQLELQMQAQQGRNEAAAQEIFTLRQELAALRDTGTQFDMSLEHSVQRLEERLARVETKTAARVSLPAEQQQVGLH